MTAIRCFIALGSNLGEPERQLRLALDALSNVPSSKLHAASPRYRNPAIGPGDQPDYVNAVAELHTSLDAIALLQQLQSIEQAQGRVRNERWGARTLDLDILLYGDAFIDLPQLLIPHPRMLVRSFVLYPLYDLTPDLVLPDGTSLRARLNCCPDTGLVRL